MNAYFLLEVSELLLGLGGHGLITFIAYFGDEGGAQFSACGRGRDRRPTRGVITAVGCDIVKMTVGSIAIALIAATPIRRFPATGAAKTVRALFRLTRGLSPSGASRQGT